MSAVILLLTSVADAHEGWGVAVHEQLGVVVSDIPGNVVWRVVGRRFEPLIRDVHSHELVVGSDGAIYGTNPEPAGNLSSVWRIDGTGNVSYVLRPSADLLLGLQSFLITSTGAIYSVNKYDHARPAIVLLRRDRSGEIRTVAGGAKGFTDGPSRSARFSGIDGMRQGTDGALVIADGARIRLVTPAGHVSTVTAPLTHPRWGEDLLGLSSVREKTIHVADHAGRRVLRVNLTNGKTEAVDKSDLFWAPSGVELSHDGLFVLEHLRPPLSMPGDLQVGPYLRVRRIVPGESSTTLAVAWGRHSWNAAMAIAAVLIAGWLGYRWRRRLRH